MPLTISHLLYVHYRKSFILENLQKLTKDKFGDLPDTTFAGQSDSSNAPPDFQSILTADGNEIHISSVMEEEYVSHNSSDYVYMYMYTCTCSTLL